MNSSIYRALSAPISHFIRSSAAIVCLAFATVSHAQTSLPQEVETLVARDIAGPFIAEALRHNPGLTAHDKRYQAARESIASSGVLPNPNVQLTHFVESIQTRTGPQRNALMLQQPIPWTRKLSTSRNVARAQAHSLWQAYAVQQFDLVDKVATQVLDIAYLGKAIALTEKNNQLLKQLESITEERVKSGGDLNDLLRLQVEIERFDDLVAREETQREAARAALQALLGNRAATSLSITDWEAPAPLGSDSEEWLTALPERNSKIALLRTLEESQEARERLASLAGKPDFTVGLNYIQTGDALNPATPGSGKDPWALMVGISLPVWNKANRAVAIQAALQTEAIAAQIEEQELLLLGQARGWIAKLEDSQQRIHRYETKLLPLASQAKEITESSYRGNRASLLDVIDTERTLIELERQYWRAAADAWVARWKLATLSGGLWLE